MGATDDYAGLRANDTFKVGDGVIQNVKQCTCCGGSVDRYLYSTGSTAFFECQDCHAIGDPFLGIMQPPLDRP